MKIFRSESVLLIKIKCKQAEGQSVFTYFFGKYCKVCGVKIVKSAGECVNSVSDASVCDSVDKNIGA